MSIMSVLILSTDALSLGFDVVQLSKREIFKMFFITRLYSPQLRIGNNIFFRVINIFIYNSIFEIYIAGMVFTTSIAHTCMFV